MTPTNEWNLELPATLDRVWRTLDGATRDQNSVFRHPAIATAADGRPEVRTVGLRTADRTRQVLCFHTDARTPKVRHLRDNPNIGFFFWDPGPQFQLRIAATARFLPHDPALWESLGDGSRLNYGVHPAPGTPIPASGAFDRAPDPALFLAVECDVQSIETLVLSEPYHRRARFDRDNGWRGTWIAP